MTKKIMLLLMSLSLISLSFIACGDSKTGTKSVEKPSAPVESVKKAESNDKASAESGEKLVRAKCMMCHSIDGKGSMASSFKGIFGSERVIITGGKERKIKADEAYLLKSMKDPSADIVKGGGVMPKIPVSDSEANSIVSYIKSLK